MNQKDAGKLKRQHPGAGESLKGLDWSTQSRARCLGSLRKTTRTVVFWAGNLWCEVISHETFLGGNITWSESWRWWYQSLSSSKTCSLLLCNQLSPNLGLKKQTTKTETIYNSWFLWVKNLRAAFLGCSGSWSIWHWNWGISWGWVIQRCNQCWKFPTRSNSFVELWTGSFGSTLWAFLQPPLHLTGELAPREKDQGTWGRGKCHAFQDSTSDVVKNWSKSRLERWFGS